MAIFKIMQKLKQLYMNLSIRYKVFLLNFIIILLISIIIGTFSYLIYSRNVIREISTVNLRDTRQIKNSIDTLQKDIYELSTFICLNDQIQKIINSDNISSITLDNINKSMEPLSGLLAFKDAISFISIYSKNGLEYYVSKDGSNGISDLAVIRKNPIYQKSIALKGKPFWVPLKDDSRIFIKDNKNPKVAMFRSVLNMDNYQIQGFLMININLSYIRNIYRDTIKESKGTIIILDENNEIISLSTTDGHHRNSIELMNILSPYINEKEGKKIFRLGQDETLLTYSTLEQSNWKILYMVPTDIVLQPVQTILFITILVILICIMIGFILSMYTSSLVTEPINKLLSSMNRVKQGNFKEKVNFIYQDEIGKLGACYNEMIDNIHQLINRVYKLQIQEKEAELRALQAQINPHFLYNTLDTIFWKAEKTKQREISNMVYALSKIFRLSLNRGEDFTTINNEKELIENYILLQKKRFNDRLDYKIDFNDNILNYSIPKLIIQPFVENAIIHGTERSNNNTFIHVSAYSKEDKLYFTIKDNGPGIEKPILEEIQNNKVLSNETTRGYAIHNVRERLDLYYDGDYKLIIDSRPGKGTVVEIILPVKRNEV